MPLMQLDLLHTLNETFLIKEMISIFLMFGVTRIVFMNLVILYRVCVTNEHWYVRFVLIVGHFLAHDLSVTYDRLLAWSAWWMPLVEQDLIYHLDLLCPTSVLMGSCCSNFSFLLWTIVCLFFFLFLTILLRYVGSGYTNVVLRLSVCLLDLKMSLYLVRILYFVVLCFPITLHQSNQAHSTTWQDSLLCKYQNVKIIH